MVRTENYENILPVVAQTRAKDTIFSVRAVLVQGALVGYSGLRTDLKYLHVVLTLSTFNLVQKEKGDMSLNEESANSPNIEVQTLHEVFGF
jgi:hypothetical protein